MTLVSPRFIGINESAHDLLIGNLFVAGISVPLYQLHVLDKIKLDNPEKMSVRQVEKIANELIENFDFWVEEIKTSELFESEVEDLECSAIFKCYSHLYKTKEDKVYLQNYCEEKELFAERLKNYSLKKNIYFEGWFIEDNLDNEHPACLAASILAKIYFNYHLRELKSHYGDIGTCGRDDPKTLSFIRERLKCLPVIVRHNNPFVKRLLGLN